MLVDTVVVGQCFLNNSALHFSLVPLCAEVQKTEGDSLRVELLFQQESLYADVSSVNC